jgi:hypothetical protein
MVNATCLLSILLFVDFERWRYGLIEVDLRSHLSAQQVTALELTLIMIMNSDQRRPLVSFGWELPCLKLDIYMMRLVRFKITANAPFR